MKILNTPLYKHKSNISFKAGITNFITDFDGTYMPNEFSHDSICRNKPPVDKAKFEKNFDGFRRLKQTMSGNVHNPKFNFVISSGRNLPEFNYFINNLREKGLKIPLPDSFIACNGGAEYTKTIKDSDFYTGKEDFAIKAEDISKEKKEWLKKVTGGYDGDKIKSDLKNMLDNAIVDDEFSKNVKDIGNLLPKERRKEARNLYVELISDKHKSENLNAVITEMFKDTIENAQKPEEVKQTISNLAWRLGEVKGGKYKLKVIDSPTNNAAIFYNKGMSLQEKLEQMGNPKHYVSFRDDGNMNFHIALNANNGNQGILLKTEKGLNAKRLDLAIIDYFRKQSEKFQADIEFLNKDGEARLITGAKGDSLKINPLVKSNAPLYYLDKFHDAKKRVDEIVKNNLNDLVIVAGDGKNDFDMLNLFNYAEGSTNNFFKNAENKNIVEKMRELPLIAIYVDNSAAKGKQIKKGQTPSASSLDKIFNDDGIIRFIHVDPNNPKKPQNLADAINLATQEYAKRNKVFNENLSPQMKALLKKRKLSYPDYTKNPKTIKPKPNPEGKIPTHGPKINPEEETKKGLTKIIESLKDPKVKKKIAFLSVGIIAIGTIIYFINKNKKTLASTTSNNKLYQPTYNLKSNGNIKKIFDKFSSKG